MNKRTHQISESTFTIVSNGFADGPAQALRGCLIKHKAKRVITISHPLVAENEGKHVIVDITSHGKRERVVRLPHRPPYTYLFDLVVPVLIPRTTAWIGFDSLAVFRGLTRRVFGRKEASAGRACDRQYHNCRPTAAHARQP
jgi:hypothetical protein